MSRLHKNLAVFLVIVLGLGSIINARTPIGRRTLWPFGEYSFHFENYKNSEKFFDLTLYVLMTTPSGLIEEKPLQNRALISPYSWDQLRKVLRNFYNRDRMKKAETGLRKLILKNRDDLQAQGQLQWPISGFRLYQEIWQLDKEKLDQKTPDRRKLLSEVYF